jgi:hypothetical protein
MIEAIHIIRAASNREACQLAQDPGVVFVDVDQLCAGVARHKPPIAGASSAADKTRLSGKTITIVQ